MSRSGISETNTAKAKPTALGTGLIALDLVLSAGSPIRAWAGGTCGNVLTVLSFLGWDSYPITRLNADAASLKVKADFKRWGVHIDYAACKPTTDTPIIVQKILKTKNGVPEHRFGWACPECGTWLPRYQPVTKKAAEEVTSRMRSPHVFFMDRLSPAAIDLATAASERGAVVVFEPSGRSDPRLLRKALAISHVLKYSRDRGILSSSRRPSNSVLLEICPFSQKGLRFRSWLPRGRAKVWNHLPIVPAPVLADTCGAGDWCTAGFISILGAGGLESFRDLTLAEVKLALRYGQALAAWNCGFEGARGGMYSV